MWKTSARWRRPTLTLFGKLYSQPHPYNPMRPARWTGCVWRATWATTWRHTARGYWPRGRVQWEAEAKAAPFSTAAGRRDVSRRWPPRAGVAGCTAGAWTGEPSLDDALSPVLNRKKTNGAAPVRF